jgi:hypothetical protein
MIPTTFFFTKKSCRNHDAGAADVSSDTAKDHTENADAFAASKQPRVWGFKAAAGEMQPIGGAVKPSKQHGVGI